MITITKLEDVSPSIQFLLVFHKGKNLVELDESRAKRTILRSQGSSMFKCRWTNLNNSCSYIEDLLIQQSLKKNKKKLWLVDHNVTTSQFCFLSRREWEVRGWLNPWILAFLVLTVLGWTLPIGDRFHMEPSNSGQEKKTYKRSVFY